MLNLFHMSYKVCKKKRTVTFNTNAGEKKNYLNKYLPLGHNVVSHYLFNSAIRT